MPESPLNGPDIFDVFQLPRHLSNVSKKKTPIYFFMVILKSVNKIKIGKFLTKIQPVLEV